MSTGQKTASETTRSSGTRDTNWLPFAITTLVVLVCAVFFTFLFGTVRGVEFNPYTFRRQTYRFVQIPFTRVQVSPTKYEDVTTTADTSVATILGKQTVPAYEAEDFGKDEDEDPPEADPAKAKSTKITPPGRWDIVRTSKMSAPTWFGDAKLLTDSMDIRNDGGNYLWDAWSKAHPKAAKVLWPIVARTAQAKVYLVIPELLETAANETDPTKLQVALESIVTKESTSLGKVFAAKADHPQALRTFELVKVYDPSSTVAQAGAKTARDAIAAKKAADGTAKGTATTAADAKATPSTPSTEAPPPAEVDSEFE